MITLRTTIEEDAKGNTIVIVHDVDKDEAKTATEAEKIAFKLIQPFVVQVTAQFLRHVVPGPIGVASGPSKEDVHLRAEIDFDIQAAGQKDNDR